MILKQHKRIIIGQQSEDNIMLKERGSSVVMEDAAKERSGSISMGSLRRRKQGAFSRPNIIDVVGQPKHKNSVLNDCLLDDARKEAMNSSVESDDANDLATNRRHRSTEEFDSGNETGRESGERMADFSEELGSLISNLKIANSKQEGERTRKESRAKILENFPRNITSTSLKDAGNISPDLEDTFDTNPDNMRHGSTLPAKHSSPLRGFSVKRSQSLPTRRGSKSTLPHLLQSLKNRNQKNNNNHNHSSDGEGSAQSMMSFESNASSYEKRSRSGSILSRLSRSSSKTNSSPMCDKRSRSGSLQRNRTGCPQYFIPGENRGRTYMPSIDLFETSSLCIKGIKFSIRRKMPRTHRAVSMIGCIGFVVPGPSSYFER